jgi:hypothetical protein
MPSYRTDSQIKEAFVQPPVVKPRHQAFKRDRARGARRKRQRGVLNEIDQRTLQDPISVEARATQATSIQHNRCSWFATEKMPHQRLNCGGWCEKQQQLQH